MRRTNYTSVNEYIKQFPQDVQSILQSVRKTIQSAAPEAAETISYQMPTFRLHGKNLVHFAGFKKHIGFYPTPSGTTAFQEKIEKYKHAKGSIQFPLSEPMPLSLITDIVKFRVRESSSEKTS